MVRFSETALYLRDMRLLIYIITVFVSEVLSCGLQVTHVDFRKEKQPKWHSMDSLFSEHGDSYGQVRYSCTDKLRILTTFSVFSVL